MSVLNLALQNCALARDKMDKEFEGNMKKCNSIMASVRKMAETLSNNDDGPAPVVHVGSADHKDSGTADEMEEEEEEVGDGDESDQEEEEEVGDGDDSDQEEEEEEVSDGDDSDHKLEEEVQVEEKEVGDGNDLDG